MYLSWGQCLFGNEKGTGGCIYISDPLWAPASISLVCQPYNSQPLTLPHPLMAWVTRLLGWVLVVREVQLRDSGDSNLACDAAVSQEDAAPVALTWTKKIKK